MKTKRILDEIGSELSIGKDELRELKEEVKKMTILLKDELRKNKISAEVFVGGSFAKGTLIKGEFYDVDFFVRFDWRYGDISAILSKVLKNIAKKKKLKLEIVHGSRDYFKIIIKDKIILEIVPVVKIKKPRESRNVTDLSYFHVNYVKRALAKKNLLREVILAKQFCKSCKVYGAESYINGFSGYALECLIAYYKSLEKMLKELSKIEIGGRVIIDPKKHYKKINDVLFEMNESKLGSPIILVDPTWKERNALAALSRESFEKFQAAAKAFLKNPSKKFFEISKFDISNFKNKVKKGEEFLSMELKTEKQPGDIAGTKMKKFSNYLKKEMSRFFEILESSFEYNGENSARFYLIVKSKKEIIKSGPPKDLDKYTGAFRKKNKVIFEKNGMLYARIKINFSAKDFVRRFHKRYKDNIKSMGITELEINN